MARYSRFKYSEGYYGSVPANLQYSVEPMSAFLLSHDENDGKVQITWSTPTGTFSQMRIVRNQDAFPETAEDGVIVYDSFLVEGTIPDNSTDDVTYSSNYPPFTTGRFAYYRAWLKKTDNAWHPAGDAFALIPSPHPTKTSRNTARAAIEEGASYRVVSASITNNVATITTDMDITTSSTAHSFETYIRVGSDIRLYGLPDIYKGSFTVTAVGPYSFSFPLTHADVAEEAVSGLVSLYPLEEDGANQSKSEYSEIALLTTHDKMVDLLPRVFTSPAQSPLDEVDTNSFLYRFLGAFAVTLDESMTFADLLRPQFSGASINPMILDLASNMYGLTKESTFASKSQKKMVKSARSLFATKGTTNTIGAVAENLTGFAPKVTLSNNLLLSVQDSSFYKGIGNWETSGNIAVSAVDIMTDEPMVGLPTASESNAIDLNWAGKIIVGTANTYLLNGSSNVFEKGIPVSEGIEYRFSYYARGTGKITPSIVWYDYFGNVVHTDNGAGYTLTGGWHKDSVTATAPSSVLSGTGVSTYGAAYASLKLKFSATGTYYVDLVSFNNSAITFYEEARAANIFLYPSKYNFLNNPSFESWTGSTLNNWTVTNGSVSKVSTTLVEAYGETYMAAFDTNVGTASISSTTDVGIAFNNNFYTFSIYAKTASGTETVTLKLLVDDNVIDPIFHVSEPVVLTTQWQRLEVTLRVLDSINPSSAALTVSLQGTMNGNVIHLDDAQLEMAYKASDYFDGSLGYIYGTFWDNTEHASASYWYPNIMKKMPRLIHDLPNYLPINSAFTISTEYRLEYKAIL
jgi:hypothetical protein